MFQEMFATPTQTPLDNVLETLAQEFIPANQDYSSFEHLFVFIEEAFWVYHDIYRQKNQALPGFSLKEFADRLLQHSPSLLPFYHGLLNVSDFSQMVEKFNEYKRNLPRFGACILNPTMDKVLLVKDKGGWGFPRGKAREGESETQSAIRELLEETGFDITGKIQPEHFISLDFHGNFFKFFIVTNIPESTGFCINTRFEIREIAWHVISQIPGFSKHPDARHFFMTIPFLRILRDWIKEHAQQFGIPVPSFYSPSQRKRKSGQLTPIPTSPSSASFLPSTPPSPTIPALKTAPSIHSTLPPNSTPLKKRKLETDITSTPPPPPAPSPMPFLSATRSSDQSGKTPKMRLMEWCQKQKIKPIFTRENAVIPASPLPAPPPTPGTPTPVHHPTQGFTITLTLPSPINRSFTSPHPSRNAREAEHSACELALLELDRNEQGIPISPQNSTLPSPFKPAASSSTTHYTFTPPSSLSSFFSTSPVSAAPSSAIPSSPILSSSTPSSTPTSSVPPSSATPSSFTHSTPSSSSSTSAHSSSAPTKPAFSVPSKEEYDDPFSVPRTLIGPALPPAPEQPEPEPDASSAVPLFQGNKHPVSFLKEVCDKRKWPAPIYETVRTEGPPHRKLFVVKVTLFNGSFLSDRGYATVKLAKEHAAASALRSMVF